MSTATEGEPAAISYLTAPGALEDGLRLAEAGIWRWRIDAQNLEWTRNLESVHRLPAGSFDGTIASFTRDIHPEDAPEVWRMIRASIETGAPYRAVYRTTSRPDGNEIWIETSGGLTEDPEGVRYLTGVCHDVSDRMRKERELERRLRQQRAVANFGSFALNEESLQKVQEEAVRVAAEVLQVPLTKILEFSDSAEGLVLRAGVGWAEGLVGRAEVGIERESQAGYTLIAGQPVIVDDLQTETRFCGPQLLHDHSVRSGISVVIPGVTSRPFGVFGIHARDVRPFDTTDAEFLQSLANIVAGAARQVAAAQHRMLLIREMAHRAGNLLQLVSSIASQTFSAHADVDVARRSFGDRLSSLARSNYVVSRGGWTLTRFSELFEETLRPFGEQITGQGRDVLLPPELCFDMGLVLHELATNSVKYGALGEEAGAVTAHWSYARLPDGSRLFRFVWDDTGIAPRPAPSRGTGFGSKLIEALIEAKWNGTATVSNEDGFRITLEVPIAD